ncbi:hypothetical protein [uncultured Microbacterium sp.]|uniref:hypothetical protein n=1 Tax=uncultured Microbacterium sp. TaxID=191216 RepID=UPI00262EEEEE|nr:hypothetical protein [uncultured Microbacterium sp.]
MTATKNPAAKTIGIITAVIGGVALIGSGTQAAVASVHALSHTDDAQTADVRGVEALSVDVAAGDVMIRFDDVEDAKLIVSGAQQASWVLERDDEDLVLRDSSGWFGWGGQDWSWFGSGIGAEQIELVLPNSLAGIDADLSLGAGSLDARGEFGELDLDISAGGVTIDGSARSLDADLGAGGADLSLADVSEADIAVSAGRFIAVFTGEAPRLTEIEVSAGSLELSLPDTAYDVRQEVSAGVLDNRLRTSSEARNSVVVSLSAGTAVLRPAR